MENSSSQTEFINKSEYLKNHASESFYKTIKVCAIISYVMTGLNALSILANFWIILDVALLLGLTIGVHIYKNKGCAVGLLAYGIFSCAMGILNAGMLTGWMWIVIPIIYLVQFSKAEKEYKAIYGA